MYIDIREKRSILVIAFWCIAVGPPVYRGSVCPENSETAVDVGKDVVSDIYGGEVGGLREFFEVDGVPEVFVVVFGGCRGHQISFVVVWLFVPFGVMSEYGKIEEFAFEIS